MNNYDIVFTWDKSKMMFNLQEIICCCDKIVIILEKLVSLVMT